MNERKRRLPTGIRQLPSGSYQATVRLPSGRKSTKAFALLRSASEWRAERLAAIARGETRDPRAGRITVAQWHERWSAAQVVVRSTLARQDSAWRTHCQPKWGRWPMDSITRIEAQQWVKALECTRRVRHNGQPVADGQDAPLLKAASVHNCVHLMSALYRAACAESPPLVTFNPFENLNLPTIAPSPVHFYEADEAQALLTALDELFPAQPQWRVLVELGLWVGLREGEIFGLFGDRVDWLRHKVEVTRVFTRDGLREYPKSRKSHRLVPVPEWVIDDMSQLLVGRDRDGLLFTTAQGHPVPDERFRQRVWNPAVRKAGIRPFPPRIMRHTAASWLVMDGVPLYDVQALLGHESFTTTSKYAHLAPDAHGRVVDSWRTSGARGSKISRKDRVS